MEVRHFCEKPAPSQPEEEENANKPTGADLNARSLNLERLMDRLEKKMEDMMVKNDSIAKSYAQAAKVGISHTLGPATSVQMQGGQKVTTLERQTVHILDEYADRERRKANIIIHNLPESTKINPGNKNQEDIENVEEMLHEGINIDGITVTKLIRLGGRGQNQNEKPRLIMATLDQPSRRRVILAAAKTLRHTESWSNVYISPDIPPAEREKERKLRDELKTRRDAGESNLIIRSSQIITRKARVTRTTQDDNEAADSAEDNATEDTADETHTTRNVSQDKETTGISNTQQ